MSNPTGNALRAAGWIDERGTIHPKRRERLTRKIRKLLLICFGVKTNKGANE